METKETKAVYQKRWRAENREKVAAGIKKWRAENPEKLAATAKKWREDNPKKVAAHRLKWNKENPEKQHAHHRKWVEANPEKRKAIDKATKAKKVENLTDGYVSSQLAKRKGMHQTAAQLREYPEIIECFRAVLKLRRLCRIKNKERS